MSSAASRLQDADPTVISLESTSVPGVHVPEELGTYSPVHSSDPNQLVGTPLAFTNGKLQGAILRFGNGDGTREEIKGDAGYFRFKGSHKSLTYLGPTIAEMLSWFSSTQNYVAFLKTSEQPFMDHYLSVLRVVHDEALIAHKCQGIGLMNSQQVDMYSVIYAFIQKHIKDWEPPAPPEFTKEEKDEFKRNQKFDVFFHFVIEDGVNGIFRIVATLHEKVKEEEKK